MKTRLTLFALGSLASLASVALGQPYNTGTIEVHEHRSTPAYTVNGTTYGPYGWDTSYTLSFDGSSVSAHAEIAFIFDPGLNYNAQQQAAYRAATESSIEGIWNNKYQIVDRRTNRTISVGVDVTTTGPTFNQTVTVKQSQGTGDPPYDMLDWYLDGEGVSDRAHEFGHMLGLFDEYIGGAVNQYPNPLLSSDGLMGLGTLRPIAVMNERYYEQFRAYVSSLNPGFNGFVLVEIPGPVTAFVLAAAAPLTLRRRRAA